MPCAVSLICKHMKPKRPFLSVIFLCLFLLKDPVSGSHGACISLPTTYLFLLLFLKVLLACIVEVLVLEAAHNLSQNLEITFIPWSKQGIYKIMSHPNFSFCCNRGLLLYYWISYYNWGNKSYNASFLYWLKFSSHWKQWTKY